ncbi:D-2-hydroxyacid dehydrogenase [Lysinibacillus pakistanensis]|uniref:D-2-hydroxyacid dehydrogenase n=1 Tax=Lysinibacillus pakistanensis TaxID=759811 RepID=A0AAX3WX47_9BACI|nr:D-2-hydroxyacid dehydrogenase [Lysinibacillus pakistanensis]MDM5230383.1 D-2-hydroxyacid dehydrogenase [Lysinibacillus pakistanensis]WHY45965.1 D-2-hydroxyacid dehydrogenase [Lysinibacillus pakistanensis]WHY50977.1 D-2-hydroxyacid dehydrogenase [Lysinibacillus pakistanensis]
MRIYFTFEPRTDLREPLVAEFPQVDFIFETGISIEELQRADVLVTYGEDLNKENMNYTTNLKWIFVASAGVEKMPAQAIMERNILVSNVRGIHKTPMAESMLAHILAIKRALPWIYEQQKKSEWSKKAKQSELRDSTALILGPGAIGSEVGRLLQAFGVTTIGCNRSGKEAAYMDNIVCFDQLIEALPKADIVISVLPKTDETTHLLNLEHFKAMKSNAIFMNFGRGNLVEEDTLIQAIQAGEIGYAVLDVFEQEPLAADHPLWSLPNVIVSPHISSHSSRYVERSLEIFKPSLEKWLRGEKDLENVMDLSRGY